MQVRCIRRFAGHNVGDVADVPDGSAVSPLFFEPVDPPPGKPAAPAAPAAGEGAAK